MEVIWILCLIIFFIFLVTIRVTYIVAYKAGARRIIAEWKDSLEGEEYE